MLTKVMIEQGKKKGLSLPETLFLLLLSPIPLTVVISLIPLIRYLVFAFWWATWVIGASYLPIPMPPVTGP